ncbi:CRISPR-associated endonuclease Cas1 [Campylobacter gracilis]|uniref:CRISPR-associated endonuclease Cas1 n=1 Tax=Campylobacter gracilis RM3268 TaxID=553220 RepID=C8PKY6_9BACT|nr:CRISPR-associated endonuclease Cas1 [Campylobacter gracilis]AKT91538.1 CRISPR/Cas system-associated endonuclease Cas1 (group II intron reverse transcriptase/maturase domain) [Campylobacter gracilis]EEV16745.1 CRISPR-associated endonuclease Cas1 [Campylobacter gracilis RM3268]UEB46253.1 CRISPR-associated endonuclease Cas1 [Campylobacter gracilis]SUW78022.1 CRISPR-associated protein Cas1 [Campylobacter gracilis]
MFDLSLEDIFTAGAFEYALKRLKRTALGFDGLSADDICSGEFYAELKSEIFSLSYSPQPLKRAFIPKEAKDELRKLAVPSLKDKFVQNILTRELSGYFDKSFSNRSYAYRNGKSYANAIYRARDFFQIFSFAVKTDIKDFFENIDHEKLLEILRANIRDARIIRLIELWIKNGIFERFDYRAHTKGVHQGDVLSPLLSNIYLNQMDKFLENSGVEFVRYADDFVMFFASYEAAEMRLARLKDFLKTISLSLNEAKTSIHGKDSEFVFLGVSFKGTNLSIGEEKFKRILAKLASSAKKQAISQSVENLNAYAYHLKAISLKLFSPSQKDRFCLHFGEVVTSLIRRFLKTADKRTLAEALINLNFPYELGKTAKKAKILTYFKNAKRPAVKSVQNALEAKKREYLKTFSQSSIIHITTPFYFLALSQGKLVLKSKGAIKHKFPINQISQIIINAQISLSSAVIKECAKKKISINFIDEKTNLSYATLISANSAIPKTAASQISLLTTKKSLRIAQQFIIGKLKNQINYLKYLGKYHKNLGAEIKAMQEILKLRVPGAASVSELMGFEGSAANSYWQAIAKAVDYEFGFSARVTQGATDIVNSALNYGYAILYSKILKSIAAAGLSPHVSYLHALDEQKPTLAFDLIEEFRAFIVDRAVISMVNKNEPFEIKDGLLSVATRQNIAKNVNEKLFACTQYRGEQLKAQDIIDRQAYALKRAVTQNEKYKPFIGRFQ